MASLKMRFFSCTFDDVKSGHLERPCLFSLPFLSQLGVPQRRVLCFSFVLSIRITRGTIAVFIFDSALSAN